MIEGVQQLDGDRVRVEAPAFPWQHVRKMGEDIVATELLFPRQPSSDPLLRGRAAGRRDLFGAGDRSRPPSSSSPPARSWWIGVTAASGGPQARPGAGNQRHHAGLPRHRLRWPLRRTEKIADDPQGHRGGRGSGRGWTAPTSCSPSGGSSAGSADHAKTVLAAQRRGAGSRRHHHAGQTRPHRRHRAVRRPSAFPDTR
jgi:hypothetical protein